MVTNKTPTPRKRPTSSAPVANTTTKIRANGIQTDPTIIVRDPGTLKDRPYARAAIATGAVTVIAAAAAAGAFLFARRDKGFKAASDELTDVVKEGFASAGETVKGSFVSASETVKDLGQRSAALFENAGSARSETRTQQQIAEEALTLKETGAAKSPVDNMTALEIKTGAIAY